MKKLLFLLFAFIVLSGHDMFLKLDTYFLAPNTDAIIKLYNGTFQMSENVIDRNRMIDVSIASQGKRIRVDTTQWSEKDSMTLLSLTTGAEGTYVAGVSTKARNIEMAADDFNNYLEHDGVFDMLEWRKANEAMEDDAIEKYSKHVKTIFQVGNIKTDDWNVELGYPIEFIPLANPYEMHTGDELSVKLLWKGNPLTNQLVFVDSEVSAYGHSHGGDTDEAHDHSHDGDNDEAHTHSHDSDEEHSHGDEVHSHSEEHSHDNEAAHSHDSDGGHSHEDDHEHGDAETHSHDHEDSAAHDDEDHSHATGTQIRTDDDGVVTFDLDSDGIYYLRTIFLENIDEPGLTHESNWATLTFEVAHDHGSAEADHIHEEDTAFGIPSYAYWLGSLAIVGILFFWFYKKAK